MNETPNNPGALSMAQEFTMRVFEDDVEKLDLQQAKQMIVDLIRQQMIKDNLTKHLIGPMMCPGLSTVENLGDIGGIIGG